MILPIIAYGDPVLKQPAKDVPEDYPELKRLIGDMFDTMYNAKGVGLAAPQVGKSLRLFIVDASPFVDDEENLENYKKAFINPHLIEETGKEWKFNEGCLSIPGIREDVPRKPKIKLRYYDEDFKLHEEEIEGLAARIIQHEYDHIEGILFVDRLSPLRKRMLKSKLGNVAKGAVDISYKMRFPFK